MAFGREGSRDGRDLQRDTAALAARLAPAAGGRVLLHCEDAYAFAVGLLATLRAGARAVLPPSRQPGALGRSASGVTAVVLDGDAAGAPAGRPCWHPLRAGDARAGPPPPPAASPDRQEPWVELFTSGTTGDERPVAKSLGQLEDEIRVLEAQLGPALGPGTRMLASVSPQHLYGLLFRVLWPLATGRPFLRSPVLHPEEILRYCDGTPFGLATTPAALRPLAERSSADATPRCRAVFCSGGPLSAQLARRAAQRFGAPPFEIYGSTETGGIALRRQARGEEPWRPLPGVEVACDPTGRLVVTSPFASAGEPRPDGRLRCTLGDLASLDDSGGFRLGGRADRVVKVGEKRLSLPEMEARLARHPTVDEAALVGLGPSGETRVGAVLVPTASGREILEAAGRRGLAKALSEHLAPDFDRVLLPRAWRVVDALPRDAQGKTPVSALRALFESAPPGRRPQVLSRRCAGRSLEAHLRIPEDLGFLEGHFPSQPVVAGVVQLHFAMDALSELLGEAPRLRELSALKFRESLLPGQEARLQLELSEEGDRFHFQLTDAADPGRVFSSGRGRLEPRR